MHRRNKRDMAHVADSHTVGSSHAHRGQPQGKTAAGVPVYNVSFSLLRRTFPERPPFRLIEVEVKAPSPPPTAVAPG